MKVLSLFSGVGGFDLGLENAGMETVFQCEWDKHATSILQRHWPDVPRWGDITTLTGRHILDHAPVIDVVAWGSPCQDLSVAGKRAGLDGSRSGLFHEGIRIIKELQEETNGKYPRISLWENVYGALSSNKGADFGVILDEMAEAGALVQEWRVLDAQYFGVPQRRRRVFVVSVFDSATAERCPDPLLPVEEGVRGDSAEGATTREGVAGAVAAGVGGGGEVTGSLTWRMKNGYNGQDAYSNLLQVVENHEHQHVVGSLAARDYKGVGNQYVQEGKLVVEHQQIVGPITTHMGSPRGTETSDSEHLVVEPFTGSQHAQYTEGVGTLRASGGDLAGGSETLLVEPFVKAKRAQSTSDDETWVEGDVNPTINQFDQGDVRATTAIVMRQREGKAGGGKGPLLSENKSLTLAAAGNDQTLFVEQPIVFENSYRDSARIAEDGVTQTLSAKMGTGGGNTPMVAIPIQDGREMEKNQNGLGIAESGAPAYTLDQTGAQAVAYSFDSLSSNSMKSSNPNSGVRETEIAKTLDTARPDPSCNQGGIAIVEPIGIQGNVIGRQDHNGPAGKGHTDEGDPMFTLNTTDRHAVVTSIGFSHTQGLSAQPSEEAFPTLRREGIGMAVAFDEYNDTLGGDVHHALRAGIKQSTGVVEPTMTVRRLTPLECERLMGWPDNWTAGQADTHRYKQCGNGVASPVAQWIGEQILNIPQ